MSTEAWGIVATVVLCGLGNMGLLLYKLGGIDTWRAGTDRRLNDLEDAVWPSRTAQPQHRSLQA